MKTRNVSTILLAFALLLAAVPPLLANRDDQAEGSRPVDRRGDLISIFSGDIEVPQGVRQRGVVVCVGCDAVIDGTVDQVVVVWGKLRLRGQVRNQVVGVLSDLELDRARADELFNILGTLDDNDSEIRGQLVNISLGSWFHGWGALVHWSILFFKFCGFVMLLAVVVAAPGRVRLMAEETPARYVPAFFVGLLGYLGALVVGTLLSVTVIGIPVAWIGFQVLKFLGMAAVLFVIGRRIGKAFDRELSLLGGVLLSFTLYLLVSAVPLTLGVFGLGLSGLLGFLFLLLVKIPGLGIVMLTLVGTRAQAPSEVIAPPPPPSIDEDVPPAPE